MDYADAKDYFLEAIILTRQSCAVNPTSSDMRKMAIKLKLLSILPANVLFDDRRIVKDSLKFFRNTPEPQLGDFAEAYWHYHVALEKLNRSDIAREFQLKALRGKNVVELVFMWIYSPRQIRTTPLSPFLNLAFMLKVFHI